MENIDNFSHLAEGVDRLQSDLNLVPDSYWGFPSALKIVTV